LVIGHYYFVSLGTKIRYDFLAMSRLFAFILCFTTTYLSHAQTGLLWYTPQSAEQGPAEGAGGIVSYTSWPDLAQQVAQRPGKPYYLRLRLSQPTEADWQALQTLPSPHRLHVTIMDTMLDSRLLNLMAQWPALRRLGLAAEVLPSSFTMVVNDKGEATIVSGRASKYGRLPQNGWEKLTGLTEVVIEGGFEPNQVLETLQAVPNLAVLDLQTFTSTNPRLVVPLSRLKKLRELTLHERDVWGSYVSALKDLVHLKKLTLTTGFISELNETLRSLPNLSTLRLTCISGRVNGKQQPSLATLRLGTLAALDTLELEAVGNQSVPISLDSTFVGLTSLRSLKANRIPLAAFPESLTANASLTTLHLPKCGLTALPATFDRLAALEDVLLDENPLGNVPDALCRQPRLRQLSLNNCELDSLPEAIGQLTTLTDLSVASNRLGESTLGTLPASIGTLRTLRSLNVGSNGLGTLPKAVGTLPNLETLAAFSNDLMALPAGFPTLKHLHLANNSFTELLLLPDTFRKLKTLTFDGNSLTALPEAIGQLDSLEFLSVNDNGLVALPTSIGRLQKLKHLSLDQNRIGQLPAEVGALGTLQLISLTNNPLETLPDAIGNWTSIQTARLQLPRLRHVPEAIGNWRQLRDLTIESDALLVLPEALTQCRRLTHLHIGGARLIGIPESIGTLQALRSLTLLGRLDSLTQQGIGAVVSLPGSLTNCQALDELIVRQQRQFEGTELLQIATQLPQLERLIMANCGLTELGYVDWKSLKAKVLNLSQNRLSALPASLPDMPHLREVDFSENNLPAALNHAFMSAKALRLAMEQ
jgi:Leucine-rich repeat (LRR) protein